MIQAKQSQRWIGEGTPMTEPEALAEPAALDSEFGQMDEDEGRHFENLLHLRAMIYGWTGEPLRQSATSLLAAYRHMRAERGVQ